MNTSTGDAVEAMPGITRGTVRLLLRPEEAAESIGISRAAIYQMLADGRIKSIKIGRSRRVPIAELNAWISSELAAQSAQHTRSPALVGCRAGLRGKERP